MRSAQVLLNSVRRSVIRAQMRGEVDGPPLKYAGYAVYTAVCDYTGIHTDTDKVCHQCNGILDLHGR